MRATNGVATHKRRKAMKRKVEGSWGTRHTTYKTAHQTYVQAQEYAYRDRKNKKRDFRKLWIARINAACRPLGITYSCLMHGLKAHEININRKMLSELAINNPDQFKALVELAQKPVAKKAKPAEPKKEAAKVAEKKTEPKKEVKAAPKKEEAKPAAKKAPAKK